MEVLVVVWPFLGSPTAVLLLHPLKYRPIILPADIMVFAFLGGRETFHSSEQLWLEVMEPGFICGHKLPEKAKLSFSLDMLCCIHFWSGSRSIGTQQADTLQQCHDLYSSIYNDAARTLAMVSYVVMVTGLPIQLPESSCHISAHQPTFSPCLIWRGNLPCCNHHVLLDLLECWALVIEMENDCTMDRNCPFYQKPLMISV